MRNSYEYVAVFDYEDDGINIYFPDLKGCISCATTTKEALKNAEEVLGLYMVECESENVDIPEPTPLEKVKCEDNEKAVLINVWMPLARLETKKVSVKKTLTIPGWLNDLAEENNVNFSKVLQAAVEDLLLYRKQ